MHKDFYASGFLYHPSTQRILLQQEQPQMDTGEWSLIGGSSLSGEDDRKALKRIFSKFLGIELKDRNIHSVYYYLNPATKKNHFVSYAHIRKAETFSSKKGKTFAWFTPKQVMKLPLSSQTKHDIVIGHRVIESGIRKSLGQQTIE